VSLRIGTRRSRLALAQANEVAARLGASGVATELVPIETSGDRGAPATASPQGLKGLFVAEIVRALIDGDVDVAVHSAKDLPAEDAPGVVLGAVPRREAPFDVLVRHAAELPDGAVVGTSSLRRRAQLLRARPGVRVVNVRGNVDTRLGKLGGKVDALVLAAAGLARLGIMPRYQTTLRADEMVPAPGQGTLVVQVREGDGETLQRIAVLEDPPTRTTLSAERALMARLGGGCTLPLGAIATLHGEGVHLTAMVATPDGERILRTDAEADGPERAADSAADRLLRRGADDILSAVREASV
jgi:hydroxymethylbilane synthase